MSLKLPPTALRLPPAWGQPSEEGWLSLRESAQTLAQSALTAGTVREDAELIRPLLLSGRAHDVITMLSDLRAARALAWLWCETRGDCRDTISVPLLIGLTRAPSSRTTIHFLAQVYFDRFDALDAESSQDENKGSILEALRLAILSLLTALDPRQAGRHGLVGALSAHRDLLLVPNSAQLVAQWATSESLQYTKTMENLGLTGFLNGRFGELLRQHLLLSVLQIVPTERAEAELAEVVQEPVFGAAHSSGLLFGHAVIMTMVDRIDTEAPPSSWSTAVLTIAGDPRVTHAESYRIWWSKLGQSRIDKVVRWIAKDELTLFLEALERLAHTPGNESMARMFPPRRRMLEGLIRENRVVRSRLFLGPIARVGVRRHDGVQHLDIARISTGSPERAMIYLECDDFHLIEGSHNTKLWVYLLTPPGQLVDTKKRAFAYEELTSELASSYEKSYFPYAANAYNGFMHKGKWQARFLSFLADRSVYVDPESILDRDDYIEFRRLPEFSKVAALAASHAKRK